MKKSLSNPRIIAALIVTGLLLFILVTALNGTLSRSFRGEEFAVLHNANSYDHFTAWKNYFYAVGRPGAVAYWTYGYEIIGYQPLIFHVLSFVFVLIGAILAAVCFSNAWPKKNGFRFITSLLIVLFFFNWLSAQRGFTLSADQAHLSMIFFFAAGLCLQRWARSGLKQTSWLATSFLLYIVCLLTYEAASFVFPALVVLAWPLVLTEKPKERRQAFKKFLVVALLSELVLLIPYFIYNLFIPYRSYIFQYIDIAGASGFVFHSLFHWGEWLGQRSDLIATLIFWAAALLAILVTWFAWKEPKVYGFGKKEVENLVSINLAAWILVLGSFLPFAILGAGADRRMYHPAMFALAPLILLPLSINSARKNFFVIGVVLSIAALLLGSYHFQQTSINLNRDEFSSNVFFIGLKEAVPSVKANTWFIFVDYKLSNSGCGAALNMLYDQKGLLCSFFSSEQNEFRASRFDGSIRANSGGYMWTENWIIIGVDQSGRPFVIPEISHDSNLIITWFSPEPIKTDYRRIVNNPSPPSDFYQYLVERQAVLTH